MTTPGSPDGPLARLPEPGWLADPARLDLERYWNGFQWTSHTRVRGSSYASGGTAAPHVVPQRRRRPRVGRGVWTLAGLTLGLIAVMGYMGTLPSWMPWPQAWVMSTPTGPQVDYPVFGSDDLVLYLARSMVAQDDHINVTFAGAATNAGMERLNDAMKEALTQNPYVFVSEWEVSVRAASTTITPTYIYDDAEAERRRAATADAVTALVNDSGALMSADPAEQVTLLHNAIAADAVYDWDAYDAINAGSKGLAIAASQEAYGILVDHTAVCTGYAEAMLLTAHALHIDAVVVTGDVDTGLTVGGHAWNRVFVNGAWRVVDVTWDDVPLGRGGGEVLRYDYLLLSPDDPLLTSRAIDSDWVLDENAGLYR